MFVVILIDTFMKEVGMEAIDLYSLRSSWGKEPILSLEPSMLSVPMEEVNNVIRESA